MLFRLGVVEFCVGVPRIQAITNMNTNTNNETRIRIFIREYTCWIFLSNARCYVMCTWRQRAWFFHEIAVNSWTQFTGGNFSQNLLTVIAFVHVQHCSKETIFREINSSLPVNAGWNTCCAMVSHARWSIDTSIVSQSRALLIHCQCKSRLQITNLGINNAF